MLKHLKFETVRKIITQRVANSLTNQCSHVEITFNLKVVERQSTAIDRNSITFNVVTRKLQLEEICRSLTKIAVLVSGKSMYVNQQQIEAVTRKLP